MGARDVLGRNELDRINEKSIDLNGYFGSVWSGLDLVLAVTPSARLQERDLGLALFVYSLNGSAMTDIQYQGFSVLAMHPEFVVLNKAPGIGMHDEDGIPGLVSEARRQLDMMLYPVHRLDKVTSGVLLLARTPDANRELSMAFAAHRVEKTYLALSQHKPKKKQGWIKGDMERGRRGSWLLTRSMNNPAITWFESYGLGDGLRLFVVQPKTGKTHQIRVALKSLGSPIIGDEWYGAPPADRVYLHAAQLKFPFQQQSWCFSAWPTQGLLFNQPQVVSLLPTALDWS